MEKTIYFIGIRRIRSEKKQKDYYLIDYITDSFVPKTDYVDVNIYNKIASKHKKPFEKCVAIMTLNDFDKAIIGDIK